MNLMTKFGELSPETVKAAYEKTGLKPEPKTFLLHGMACALGVFCEAHAPGEFQRLGRDDEGAYVSGTERSVKILGITTEESRNITRGFFGNLSEDGRELGYAIHQAIFGEGETDEN